jgi:hypothetical protein
VRGNIKSFEKPFTHAEVVALAERILKRFGGDRNKAGRYARSMENRYESSKWAQVVEVLATSGRHHAKIDRGGNEREDAAMTHSAERELDQWLDNNGYRHARSKKTGRTRAHATMPQARRFRLVEQHAPTDVGGRIDVTIIETITPQSGGITVDRHVKGMQEGRRIDDHHRKFYPGVTMEKAVAYRQRSGYTELS